MSILSTEEANLLHETPKIIIDKIIWKSLDGNRFRMEVKVLANKIDKILKLNCFKGKTNYSFTLLYKNYPIRRYTKHHIHCSKSTGEIFTEPHKHIWESDNENDKAYIPTDINPNDSIEKQLFSFLKEENITIQSNYQTSMFT